MRSALGLAASALAGLAAVIASLDGDGDIVPFFVGLTFAGGVAAWAAHPPFAGPRARVAKAVALVWLVAAIWVGVLLAMYVTMFWQGSSTVPATPEPVQTVSRHPGDRVPPRGAVRRGGLGAAPGLRSPRLVRQRRDCDPSRVLTLTEPGRGRGRRVAPGGVRRSERRRMRRSERRPGDRPGTGPAAYAPTSANRSPA